MEAVVCRSLRIVKIAESCVVGVIATVLLGGNIVIVPSSSGGGCDDTWSRNSEGVGTPYVASVRSAGDESSAAVVTAELAVVMVTAELASDATDGVTRSPAAGGAIPGSEWAIGIWLEAWVSRRLSGIAWACCDLLLPEGGIRLDCCPSIAEVGGIAGGGGDNAEDSSAQLAGGDGGSFDADDEGSVHVQVW